MVPPGLPALGGGHDGCRASGGGGAAPAGEGDADVRCGHARAKMALGVLKGSPTLAKDFESEGDIKVTAKVFARILCPFSPRGAHLAVLKWARAHGCLWDEWTCAAAALKLHHAVLQWLQAHGCTWNAETCKMAAENGHLEVFQCARAHGCPE